MNAAATPKVSNPTDNVVNSCSAQSSSFETILQELESLPIGSQGQQILQTIEQLLGPAQSSCQMPGQSGYNAPQGGSLPTTTLVQPAALSPTKDSNGKNSSSGLYQSLFP